MVNSGNAKVLSYSLGNPPESKKKKEFTVEMHSEVQFFSLIMEDFCRVLFLPDKGAHIYDDSVELNF